jgi:hypothetical protein
VPWLLSGSVRRGVWPCGTVGTSPPASGDRARRQTRPAHRARELVRGTGLAPGRSPAPARAALTVRAFSSAGSYQQSATCWVAVRSSSRAAGAWLCRPARVGRGGSGRGDRLRWLADVVHGCWRPGCATRRWRLTTAMRPWSGTRRKVGDVRGGRVPLQVPCCLSDRSVMEVPASVHGSCRDTPIGGCRASCVRRVIDGPIAWPLAPVGLSARPRYSSDPATPSTGCRSSWLRPSAAGSGCRHRRCPASRRTCAARRPVRGRPVRGRPGRRRSRRR